MESILRGFVGLLLVIGMAFLFSGGKRAINWRLVVMGILPLIGVLSHLFPAVSNFFSSWVVPTMQSMR